MPNNATVYKELCTKKKSLGSAGKLQCLILFRRTKRNFQKLRKSMLKKEKCYYYAEFEHLLFSDSIKHVYVLSYLRIVD